MIYFVTLEPGTDRVLGHCATPDAIAARMYLDATPNAMRIDSEPPKDWQHKRFVAGAFIDLDEKPMPPDGEVQGAIRRELAATDYTQVADYPISDELLAAWRTYRQALRDIQNAPVTREVLASFPTDPKGRNLAQASGWI